CRMSVPGQVGELLCPAAGRFGNTRPTIRTLVLAAAEERNEPPIMLLFDLTCQRMVVTLSALDANAEERRRDCLGNLLMRVAPFEQKPAGADVRFLGGPREHHIARHAVPRPV